MPDGPWSSGCYDAVASGMYVHRTEGGRRVVACVLGKIVVAGVDGHDTYHLKLRIGGSGGREFWDWASRWEAGA